MTHGTRGLSDVDAIAVSLSRMAPEELALAAAAGAIAVAALVNTVVKGCIHWRRHDRSPRWAH